MCGKQLITLLGLILLIFHEIYVEGQEELGLSNDENYCYKDNPELVQLSPYNQGDVYLISQWMIIITAFEA